MKTNQNILLVDGMALLFRAFYATSFSGYIMKTSYGLPTNAVHGFVKYFLNAIETFNPSHVVCCWDMGAKTFRNELYAGYKANREEPPAELIPQFDLIKDVMESFQVPNVGVPRYEADDCLGTLAKEYSKHSNVHILTGDHDILQLLDDNIRVIIMKKGQGNYAVYSTDTLMEEKKLTPSQFIDLKGLMGDSSDNYPGVKGIGEKTALKLLHEYQSIDGILANLEFLPKGIRSKIESDLEMLHLSRKLATIHCEAPVECDLDTAVWTLKREPVKRKFEELEFKSLVKMIG